MAVIVITGIIAAIIKKKKYAETGGTLGLFGSQYYPCYSFYSAGFGVQFARFLGLVTYRKLFGDGGVSPGDRGRLIINVRWRCDNGYVF